MAIDYKPELKEYKNLTPFKTWLVTQINTWGINNFPFLESDFDQLTNYGMLMKMMKCLNDIISNENEVEQNVYLLYGAFTELQDYINNYFDNLDVQEEIDKKLDEMFESGYLPQLIQNYVNKLYVTFQEDLDSYKQVVNNDLLSMNTKINNSISNSPIVVSSVEQMTDNTKIYINTSNNKWYYYNGSEFVIGGDFLGSTFSDNSITNNMINSIDYSKVIKDSIINDFSEITAWRNAVCVGGYRTITIDTTNSSNSPSGAITPILNIDTNKDLYIYFNANGNINGYIFLYDNSTIKKQIIINYALENDRRTYIKISKNELQGINNPIIRFLGEGSGLLTFSDIIINQYDFLSLADNLLNAINQINYNNFSDNLITTKFYNWSRSYGPISLVPLIQHSTNSFDIVYNDETSNFRGWKSPFNINFNGYLIIEFDCNVPTGLNTNLFMVDNNNNFISIAENITSGHYKYNIDLSYYAIYHNFNEWSFMISSNKDNISDILVLSITNFKFYVSKITNLDIYDENFENMIEKIGNKLSNINYNTEVKTYISNGNEKCIIRSNNNGLVSIPVVPNKTLIIGNSLLLGNTHGDYSFGMASSNIESDYFYHFSEYIKNIKSSSSFTKLSGVNFESSTNDTMYNSFINTLNSYLSNDLDLVIIQLGDNVNTPEKIAYFENSCKNLVQYIGTHCPNARIVWVGMWYSNITKINIINKMIFETGTEFINIQDIRNTKTESAIGNIITYPDGYSTTITNSGVASHPGDLGMEKIANRLLFKLGIKETE